MSVSSFEYGSYHGQTAKCFVIENNNGCKAQIIEKGATLDRLYIRAKDGGLTDVLVGLDDLQGHMEHSDYQGVIVGQYANRIAGGSFSIDGKTYEVTKNEKGITCLHGGGEYSYAFWHGEESGESAVTFTYQSPDGREGFPGNVSISVTYAFNDDDALSIRYKAVSDKKTVLNFTNHAYFNLNGFDGGSILGHRLRLFADEFTPIDKSSIPLGEIRPVKGTPFDFTEFKEIGRDIEGPCEQLKNGNGYDHNFVIRGFNGLLRTAAVAESAESGIRMEVRTTLPGIQFYSGNFLDGSVMGKADKPLLKRSAFCLETQVFPDSPHHPEWPRCIYDAGEEYRSETVYAFSLKR